jgi:3-isopropylmalate dehydrogenase
MLPGDGIGPEVCGEVQRVADWMIERAGLDLRIVEHRLGGGAYDDSGSPLPEETKLAAMDADAVLLGAVGGPKWAGVPRQERPEAGLLNLRKAMGVYANLRPAFCFEPLASASTLKPEVVTGLDLVFVRELTGGVYFGEPRGIESLADGSRRGVDTQVYTTPEIERVARVAFELARTRRNKITSVDKSNVMESGLLWRETVTALHARDYADVELGHMYADNTAMQLVRNPRQFDVLLTDNLFGDVLSDEASMLAGSIGLLPSAALGDRGQAGLYEPIHGSAPDIAGANIANPIAAILSFEMALRWSLDRLDLADQLRTAVAAVLDAGARTSDLGGKLTTTEMGDAVLHQLNANALVIA